MTPVIDEACYRSVDYLLRKVPYHLREDCRQAGLLGMVEAAQKFDATRACFRTYATFRARCAMLDYLRGQDVVSRKQRQQIRRGDAPAVYSVGIEDRTHAVCRERSPELQAAFNELRGHMATLSERDAFVLGSLYLDEWSAPEVAQSLGVSIGHVYNLRDRALRQLRRIYLPQ